MIKLIEILVISKIPVDNLGPYKTKKEFNDTLRERPISSIDKGTLIYKLVKNEQEMHFCLEKSQIKNKWKFRHMEKDSILTFSCTDDRKFMDTFEEHLIGELKKKEEEEYRKKYPNSFPSPVSDAKASMDGQ